MAKSKNYVIYLDESGRAEDKKPFFLTACIFENSYVVNRIENNLKNFKKTCFQNQEIPLHYMDICKRSNDFSKERVDEKQINTFWQQVPLFLNSLNMKIISVLVDKEKLAKHFKTPKDSYAVAFGNLMKSIYYFLDDEKVKKVYIVMESRSEEANFIVQKAFFEIFYGGTVHLNITEKHRNKIASFELTGKSNHLAGLEIVDLVCYPLKHIRLKGEIEGDQELTIFNSIKEKLYTPLSDNDVKNWSFKKVPQVKKNGSWNQNT